MCIGSIYTMGPTNHTRNVLETVRKASYPCLELSVAILYYVLL